MDEQIGRLRGKLEELGVAKNTLVFFCSDNGPENRTPGTAGPLRARKRALYEGGIRVPGVAVWPAVIKAGSVTDIPCVTSDYLPTVAEATGASIKQAAQPQDGISLMPLFKQQMKERPAAIAFQFGGKSCLIDNRFKLYREKGKVELYDIPADAGEANDVASKHSELVQEMTKKLDAWQESCKRSNAGEDYR
jgi:arylsulfatase A-like enzyme